jgi:hypothetical protein
MGVQVFAGACILICLVAIYFAWKIYRDTRQLKKKAEEEEEKIDFS